MYIVETWVGGYVQPEEREGVAHVGGAEMRGFTGGGVTRCVRMYVV